MYRDKNSSPLVDPVPVVLLVVEGGPNTVRTGEQDACTTRRLTSLTRLFLVHEAVVQNNIPAVFLEGTGRCCDLFAKAFHLYKEYRPKSEVGDDTAAK